MDGSPEAFSRFMRFSLVGTALGAAMLEIAANPSQSLGFLFGGLWSAANFWALRRLIGEWMGPRRTWMLILAVNVKLPVLYGLGAWVLLSAPISVPMAAAGFHVPFAVLVAGAVADARRAARADGAANEDNPLDSEESISWRRNITKR